ncbi:MAG: trypsin-like peptidase domain-containing protein [Lysobacteraceae bacterium]
MQWFQAIEVIAPTVFRISTPDGSGTGWLVSRSANSNLCVVATAAHVIESAHYWEKPIRVTHHQTGASVLLRVDARAVMIDPDKDSAAIIFQIGEFQLPQENPQLFWRDHNLKQGNEIGWLGFPAVQSRDLCFFEGHISAYLEAENAYLVDGVAINGVSGGPAFWKHEENIQMIGLVSAYIPNRSTGIALPGVALIRDVNQFHNYADRLRSLDEAQAQQSPHTEASPAGDDETNTRLRNQ